MSKQVDTRVVQMKFDNRQFEKNMQETMASLNKLDEKLQFKDASKGFDEITKASEKIKLGALGEAVDTVKVKFSAFEVVAITALTNIANKAVNAGERLVKSLSIDNVASGWQKFQDTTTSVGTLISQGFSMDEVEKQLERLNWFTDETSYNFTDMVNNIGKFTATGQSLEDSVQAMEGIANWAALSGANAQKASMAMYQLAQAMGKGALKYDDYKSIQNVNMDTREFRQIALDAAVAAGTLTKGLNGVYKTIEGHEFTIDSFGTYLSTDSWLTSKVMMDSFRKYSSAVDYLYSKIGTVNEKTGETIETASDAISIFGNEIDAFGLKAFKAAQEARTWTDVIDSVKDAVSSQWKATFETIFGNYEEAKRLFTFLANTLYDVFAGPLSARNELLKSWKEDGGREKLLDALAAGYYNIADAVNAVKEAFRSVFPEKTSDDIMNATEAFRKFMYNIKLTEKETEQLKTFFTGLFSMLKEFKNIFASIIKAFVPGTRTMTSFREILFYVIESLGTAMSKLSELLVKTNLAENLFKGIQTIMKYAEKAFIFAGDAFNYLLDKIVQFTEGMNKLAPVLAGAGGVGGILAGIFVTFTIVNNTLGKLFKIFKNGFSIVTAIKDMFFGIIGIVDKIRKTLSMKLITETVKNVFFVTMSIGSLAVSLYALSKIEPEELAKGLIAISILAGVVTGIAVALSTINAKTTVIAGILKKIKSAGLVRLATSTVMVVGAIALLAGTLTKLKDISIIELGRGLLVISSLALVVEGIMALTRVISKINGKGLFGSATSILFTSASIFMLAKIAIDLSQYSITELTKGIGAIASIGLVIEGINWLAHLASKGNGFKFGSGLFASSNSLLLTSISILIIAEMAKSLSKLSVPELGKGIGAIIVLGSVIEGINYFAHKISKVEKGTKIKNLLGPSGSLVLTATAMLITADIAKKLSELSITELGKGIGAVTALGILIEIMNSWAIKALTIKEKGTKIKSLLGPSGALILTSTAMLIMSEIAKSLSELSITELGKGIGAVTALGILIETMNWFANKAGKLNAKGLIKSATSMIEISLAVGILADIAKKMSELTADQFLKGIGSVILLGSFIEVLNHISSNIASMEGFNAWNSLASSGSLLMISFAINLLANMAIDLANAEGDIVNGIAGVGALSLLAIALGEVVKTLGNISFTSIPSMLVGIVPLGVIMFELAMFLPVFKELAEVPTINLISAGATATIMVLAMGAVVTGLGKISLSSIPGLLAGLISIGSLMLLINKLIVPAFMSLEKVNWAKAWINVLNLSGVLLTLTGALAGIGTLTIFALPAVAAAIIALGVAFGVLASTIIPTVQSITELSNSLSILNEMVIQNPIGKIVDQLIKTADELMQPGGVFEKKLIRLGQFTAEGVIKGIDSKIELVKDAARRLGMAVCIGYAEQQQIDSPGKEMEILAKFSVAGLMKGFDDSIPELQNKGAELGKAITGPVRDGVRTEFAAMTADAQAEFDRMMKITERYEREKGRKAVQALTQESDTGFFSTLKHVVLGTSTNNAKVAQDTVKNVKNVIDIDQQLVDAQRKAKEAEADANKKAAEAQELANAQMDESTKYLDQLRDEFNILTDELNANTSEWESNGEAMSKAASAATKTKSVYETLKDTITSQMDLFSEFNLNTDITAEDMLRNMSSQILGIQGWSDNLARLSMRGLDEGLLKQLGDIGPQGYAKVAAFAQMTDEQLREANNMFKISLKLPGYAADEVASSYTYAGEMAIKGFSNALDKFKGLMAGYELGQSTIEDISRALNDYTPIVTTQAKTTGKKTYQSMEEEINEPKGVELVNQLLTGMDVAFRLSDKAKILDKDARSLAKRINYCFKEEQQINSPSKVWYSFGEYMMDGLINALDDNTGRATDTVDTVTSAIDIALATLEESDRLTPVLTPILDLSEIQNGAGELDTMLESETVSIAAKGFNANIEAARQAQQQSNLLNMLNGAMQKYSADIVEAIANSEVPVNVNVTLQGESAGIFKMVRAENTRFTKINGYNALAT